MKTNQCTIFISHYLLLTHLINNLCYSQFQIIFSSLHSSCHSKDIMIGLLISHPKSAINMQSSKLYYKHSLADVILPLKPGMLCDIIYAHTNIKIRVGFLQNIINQNTAIPMTENLII